MGKLSELVELVSGSPQFRITEVFDEKTPLFTYYSQTNLTDDLVGIISKTVDNKQVRTNDKLNTLCDGDVVFSLTTGIATIVRKEHEGYIYTQNYVKLVPSNKIDSKFLVYLINENKTIKKQFMLGLQGSQVLKYTLKQLKELEITKIPSIDKQEIIGQVYFNQLRLETLRNRAAEFETRIKLSKLEEACER
ncbi:MULTISPECIES: restriction endonuclease subunit S [Clostridium]|uniref:restriction endonuclease subunit S n=1 Tax=Clostridium TaxID=1485 RepID=UPI0013F8D0D2|nr:MULTISPECIES: restriction endonuclease subunit S [Clostridium]MBN1065008.1 restriction endonuclease subunit M [Clostridium botulinum]MBY6811077.1 restriction endonuclease subunit S [Clostridium botulinum]MBY6824545.1 restriction endonuclease subunit S [Clostridium botulinum]MBY6834961.1 restriction endonuclease subunit S [Clostridium botulinum]MBY6974307.1 restriction endonuclease subunit S [Clostridium botulinum]